MNPAETYMFNQQEPYKGILLHLRFIVERTLPEIDLKFKWSIPCFYYENRPICYLNVSETKKYVDIAFWNASSLTKHLDKMISEKRKVIKSLRYFSLEEIDDSILKEVLLEAYNLKHKKFYK